jgi:hypothetical protein
MCLISGLPANYHNASDSHALKRQLDIWDGLLREISRGLAALSTACMSGRGSVRPEMAVGDVVKTKTRCVKFIQVLLLDNLVKDQFLQVVAFILKHFAGEELPNAANLSIFKDPLDCYGPYGVVSISKGLVHCFKTQRRG